MSLYSSVNRLQLNIFLNIQGVLIEDVKMYMKKIWKKCFRQKKSIIFIMLLHSLGLVYKSVRGMMTNSIDRDPWLNVT
jgi:hypothetical protein